jgi:hypothetical protein
MMAAVFGMRLPEWPQGVILANELGAGKAAAALPFGFLQI